MTSGAAGSVEFEDLAQILAGADDRADDADALEHRVEDRHRELAGLGQRHAARAGRRAAATRGLPDRRRGSPSGRRRRRRRRAPGSRRPGPRPTASTATWRRAAWPARASPGRTSTPTTVAPAIAAYCTARWPRPPIPTMLTRSVERAPDTQATTGAEPGPEVPRHGGVGGADRGVHRSRRVDDRRGWPRRRSRPPSRPRMAGSASEASSTRCTHPALRHRRRRDAVQLDQIGLRRSRQLDRALRARRVGPGCVENDRATALQHRPSVVQQRAVGGLGDLRLVQPGPVRRRHRLVHAEERELLADHIGPEEVGLHPIRQAAGHSGLAHARQAADQHEANLCGTQVMHCDPDVGTRLQLRTRVALRGPQAGHLGPHEGAVGDVVVGQGGDLGGVAGELHVRSRGTTAPSVGRARAARGPWRGTRRRRGRPRSAAGRRTRGSPAPAGRPAAEHVVGEQVAVAVPDQPGGRPVERTAAPARRDSAARGARPPPSPPRPGRHRGTAGSARSSPASAAAPRPGEPSAAVCRSCRAVAWKAASCRASARSPARTSTPDLTSVDRRRLAGMRRITTRESHSSPSRPGDVGDAEVHVGREPAVEHNLALARLPPGADGA